MVVKLSPQVSLRIERLVESGRYASADDVLNEALSVLEHEDPDYWEWIAGLDAEADASVAAGRTRPLSGDFVEHLRSLVTRKQ